MDAQLIDWRFNNHARGPHGFALGKGVPGDSGRNVMLRWPTHNRDDWFVDCVVSFFRLNLWHCVTICVSLFASWCGWKNSSYRIPNGSRSLIHQTISDLFWPLHAQRDSSQSSHGEFSQLMIAGCEYQEHIDRRSSISMLNLLVPWMWKRLNNTFLCDSFGRACSPSVTKIGILMPMKGWESRVYRTCLVMTLRKKCHSAPRCAS